MLSIKLTACRFLIALVAATAITSPAVLADHKMMKHQVGLDGYCPVCVIAAKKWEKGAPSLASTYDGTTYYFPSAAIQKKFDDNPAAFVPVLNGDCIVCYAMHGKRVPGSVHHASLYQNRLYLFPSDKEKQVFEANPDKYTSSDLAAKGECAVCLVKAGKHVPGSEEYTEIHNGLRYLFPSAREQQEFRRDPKMYADKTMMMMDTKKVSMRDGNNTITVAGRSGCAACEHGVTPLGAPDELGLAVTTNDGRIIVVENAHELYPDVYAARFEGRPLKVEGMIVKTDGKISWLKPSSLRVLN